MMNARNEFVIGQRVKLSAEGVRLLGGGRTKYKYDEALRGTVRGFGHELQAVRIQRDGIKTTDTYHMDFWEAEVAPYR